MNNPMKSMNNPMKSMNNPMKSMNNPISLAKELDFVFDKNGSMYFLTKDNKAVLQTRSLEEINGFLLGFKHGFRYSKKTCSYCYIDYKKAVAYDKEVGI